MMSRTWKLSVIAFLTAVTFLTQVADSQAFHRARCRRAYRHNSCATCSVDQDGGFQNEMDGNTPPPAPTADMSSPPQPSA